MFMLAIACNPAHSSIRYTGEEKRVWLVLTLCLYALSILVMTSWVCRYFRQQNALRQGRVLTGGVEVYVGCLAVLVAVVTVGAAAWKYYETW
jgi:uncharacterized membrane protein YidH (DUF202 family)